MNLSPTSASECTGGVSGRFGVRGRGRGGFKLRVQVGGAAASLAHDEARAQKEVSAGCSVRGDSLSLSLVRRFEGRSSVGVGDGLFDVRDGLAGVEVLGAGLGAVHDGVAAVELEGVVECLPHPRHQQRERERDSRFEIRDSSRGARPGAWQKRRGLFCCVCVQPRGARSGIRRVSPRSNGKPA